MNDSTEIKKTGLYSKSLYFIVANRGKVILLLWLLFNSLWFSILLYDTNTFHLKESDLAIEEQDVIQLELTLFIDGSKIYKNKGLFYIIKPTLTIDTIVSRRFTDIEKPDTVGLYNVLLGMQIDQLKDVVIDKDNGFTNVDDEFFGKNLRYVIQIKQIVVDNSFPQLISYYLDYDENLSGRLNIELIPFMEYLIFLDIVLIVGSIGIFFLKSDRMKSILYTKRICSICKVKADLQCNCRELYCKECFELSGNCLNCKKNIVKPLKILENVNTNVGIIYFLLSLLFLFTSIFVSFQTIFVTAELQFLTELSFFLIALFFFLYGLLLLFYDFTRSKVKTLL